MLLFVPLLAGVVVGVFMAWLFGRLSHLGLNIVYGIVGAFVFRLLAYFIAHPFRALSRFTWTGLIVSLLGAMVFTMVPKLARPVTDVVEGDDEDEEKSDDSSDNDEEDSKSSE